MPNGSNALTVGAVYGAVKKLDQALCPSLHHRKEGWLRHQVNFAQPPKLTQPGWFSFCSHRKTTPASRSSGGFAIIFLIARPPLLAVMQGGA